MTYQITEIRKSSGSGLHVIAINGFLSEGNFESDDWIQLIDQRYPRARVSHFHWPASNLTKIIGKYARVGPTDYLNSSIFDRFKPTTYERDQQLEWYRSIQHAAKAGRHLAKCIDVLEHDFVLMGHSLGARVIFNALKNTTKLNKVNAAYLFGGAVSSSDRWDRILERNRSLKIVNCYSNNDMVLKAAYQLSIGFKHEPVGLQPIDQGFKKQLYNVNLSSIVNGHTKYKKEEVGRRLRKVKFNDQGKQARREKWLRENCEGAYESQADIIQARTKPATSSVIANVSRSKQIALAKLSATLLLVSKTGFNMESA
ncbi:DUF726 domain-containing protein [Vibrio sp. PID17_43]|uniref:DUF726 domain-containing protein n=1 Tax=Vibrio sp. PID17_43 TaxID=1583451 RepID=UPI000BFFD003|nr:DUF726 domain-containing protein [Vibrio sp. PID17_43]